MIRLVCEDDFVHGQMDMRVVSNHKGKYKRRTKSYRPSSTAKVPKDSTLFLQHIPTSIMKFISIAAFTMLAVACGAVPAKGRCPFILLLEILNIDLA